MDMDALLSDVKIKNVIDFNVNKFQWAFDSPEDARQEAYLFLWQVAQKYDGRSTCSMASFFSTCLRRKFITLANKHVQGRQVKYNSALIPLLDLSTSPNDSYDIQDLFKFLPERNRIFVKEYYFNRKTLVEISKEYGVSIERARQIIRTSIKHLHFLLKEPKNGQGSCKGVGYQVSKCR